LCSPHPPRGVGLSASWLGTLSRKGRGRNPLPPRSLTGIAQQMQFVVAPWATICRPFGAKTTASLPAAARSGKLRVGVARSRSERCDVGQRAAALILLAGLVAGCSGKSNPSTAPGTTVPASAEDKKPPDGPGVKQVMPTERWSGEVTDPELEKLAPESSVITTRADFGKVWEAWWRFGKIPEVDFKTSFVAVRTWSPKKKKPVEGMDGVWIVAMKLAPDGSAEILHEPSLATSGPGEKPIQWAETKGFYWGISVFPRDGVKTVDGKELPAP